MKCPECNREMRGVTARKPEDAWRCDYCASKWIRADKTKAGISICKHSIPTDRRCFDCWPNIGVPEGEGK